MKSSRTSTNPLNSACRLWPGCVAWPAGRHRPGWRQCPQHSHCSSLMETSGPPCVGASANPTFRPALLPPPASAGPKSALQEPSMPSHAMPSMHCAYCAMMKLWSCSNCGVCPPPRSLGLLYSIHARWGPSHLPAHAETCCSPSRGNSARVTCPSSTQGLPHTARPLRRPTGAPLLGGMRAKRPSIGDTEQAATSSCPSQWRPVAALVGPLWTCLPTCRPRLASTATAPSRESSLSRACSAN
jgi:hypothetical protein